MSEINANFVVDPITLTVQQNDPGLTITPDVTQLNIYAGGYAQPQGNIGELQYNVDGSRLGGAANTLVTSGNLRFTNLANLKINGGANAYFLQTDGTGNLTWAQGTANVSGNGTAAGANTQIQISDGTGNFTSGAGFTFDTASNLFSVPGNAIIASNLTVNNIAVTSNISVNNIAVTSNISVNNVTVTNNVAANVVKTDNLLYANGTPWDLDNPGGSNTAIQYNDNESFGGSNAFTFDSVSNAVVLTGNITTNNANLGNSVNANYFIGNLYGQANTAVSANTAGTVTTNAQPNITSVGTLSSLTITGNLSSGNANLGNNANANFFYGNGAFLTGIDTSRISNGNSNVRVFANSDVTISIVGVANRVVFDQNAARYSNYALSQQSGANNIFLDQGRISMGLENQTLGMVTRAYNNTTSDTARTEYYRTRGNSSVPTAVLANDEVSNLRNYVYADSGNQNYNTTTLVDTVNSNDNNGNVVSTFQIRKYTTGDKIELYAPLVKVTSNGSNNILLYGNGDITTIGNITANIFSGNANALSNIPGANVTGVVANAGYAANAGNANTAGTVTTNAQPNITSVGNLSSLTVVGNINANNINGGNLVTANYFSGVLVTANQPNITSVGNLTNLVVTGNTTSGNIDGGNLVTANYFSGVLVTANQPNITTVGNLTNLVVTGNITGNNLSITNYANANNINATEWANANNINVTANLSAGNVKTDNLLYANGTPWDLEQPGGANTTIQYNNNNSFGGSNAFTFNETTNVVTINGQLTLNNTSVILGNGATTNANANIQYNILIGANALGANLLSPASNSIAIGTDAKVYEPNAIAIGKLANAYYPNSITLNATGANLVSGGDGRFTVKPISQGTAGNVLYYDSNTGVISYALANGSDRISNVTESNTKVIALQNAIQFDPYNGNANSNLIYFGNTAADFRVPVVAAIFESTNYIKFTAKTVANLPLPANVGGAGVGARLFVSDSNRAAIGNFGEIVANGGSNYVPVFSDGTNWRIG